jgi:phosphonate transport system substrate-binding protein
MTPLRFVTFLAPSLFPVYQFIADYVGAQLDCPTTLRVGARFSEFAAGEADVGFICGLPYVQLTRETPPPVELLAAPVLQGPRYGGRPIYYSDVIVRRDSPLHTFADLRGCRWSYNDPDSHSGYNITRYRLVQLGETGGYFGKVVEAGWHQRSIELVRAGLVDASAIDSHVLAVAMRDDPALADAVRVIDVLGPATIQPVVVARQVPDGRKAAIQAALLALGADSAARARLAEGLIDHFVAVTDATYDDIRAMVAACESADFLTLR